MYFSISIFQFYINFSTKCYVCQVAPTKKRVLRTASFFVVCGAPDGAMFSIGLVTGGNTLSSMSARWRACCHRQPHYVSKACQVRFCQFFSIRSGALGSALTYIKICQSELTSQKADHYVLLNSIFDFSTYGGCSGCIPLYIAL